MWRFYIAFLILTGLVQHATAQCPCGCMPNGFTGQFQQQRQPFFYSGSVQYGYGQQQPFGVVESIGPYYSQPQWQPQYAPQYVVPQYAPQYDYGHRRSAPFLEVDAGLRLGGRCRGGVCR